MNLFFRFIWPRSRKSLAVWVPLIAAGLIACIGLSLALGFRSGVLNQQSAIVLRDGGTSFGPNRVPPTLDPDGPPLRSSELISTGYGPLAVTTFWGVEGQRIGIPGLDRVEKPGTVLASPAVRAQLDDDWTGELDAWLGGRSPGRLPDAALTHPREMVIVEFIDTAPSDDAALAFYPVRARTPRYAEDTSFVVFGLLVLVLPSMALARAAAAVHLNTRSRRYGLLRVLGAQPRQLAAVIAADMAAPMLAGAFIGSIAYAVVMWSLDSFTLAGASYWTSDLRLVIPLAIALPFVVASVGMASVARMVYRAGGDPIGTLRRSGRPPRFVSYLMAAGAVAGPIIAYYSYSELDGGTSQWVYTAALLLSIVGLEGLSRIATAGAGKVLGALTRAQIAGARMFRAGSDSLLGVSATSVAVFLIVAITYSNYDPRPPDIGDFDIVAWVRGDTDVTSMERVGDAAEAYEGVTRVVHVGSPRVSAGARNFLYTMTCEDAPGSVKLDAPCETRRVYLSGVPLAGLDRVDTSVDSVLVTEDSPRFPLPPTIPPEYRDVVPPPLPPFPEHLTGSIPVGGIFTSSWASNIPVMMVDEQPPVENGVLLITTDGQGESMRRVIHGLRQFPDVQSTQVRAALTSVITQATLVTNPYFFVMATTAAAIAAIALLYAVLLLFRQRQAEFKMLRCQGATRMLLSVDLGLLFAAPLVISFGLAIASGIAMAAAFNTALDLPMPAQSPQTTAVLIIVAAVGAAATALVAGFAARVSPLIADPDAAAT